MTNYAEEKKSWEIYFSEMKPNEKQQLFINILKDNPDGTLQEISKIAKTKFTIGHIAALIRKGFVVETGIKIEKNYMTKTYRVADGNK